jgi:hypothetical protein
MSFYMHFTARSKSHAKQLLERHTAPAEVKAFVSVAVDNLPNTDGVRLIRVEANGHLCSSRGDSPQSNATIKVEPVEAAE